MMFYYKVMICVGMLFGISVFGGQFVTGSFDETGLSFDDFMEWPFQKRDALVIEGTGSRFDGCVFSVIPEKVSWDEADVLCRQAGGLLVPVVNPYIQGLVSTLVNDYGDNAWIGVSRVDTRENVSLVSGSFADWFIKPIHDSNDSRNIGGAAMLSSGYAGRNNPVVGEWWFHNERHSYYRPLGFVCVWENRDLAKEYVSLMETYIPVPTKVVSSVKRRNITITGVVPYSEIGIPVARSCYRRQKRSRGTENTMVTLGKEKTDFRRL